MTTYPSDWKVVALGEVCEIQLGKMLDSENNTGDLYPYLTNKDVQWSRIDFSDIGTIRLTDDDRRKFSLSDGDLLVCEGGEVGRCAIWRGEISNCYFQKTLHRVRARSNGVVSLPFVASLFRQYASNGTLSFYTSQTSIAHLTKDKVAILPIPLPPLPEQKRIAGVLGDMDKLIENLGKRIEKKRQIKKGAMQELLTGKKRLSGFKGEWVERKIRKMLTIGHGRDYKHLANGTTPVYGSGGLMCYVDGWLHDGETVCIGRKGTIDEPMYHNGKIWTVDTLFYTHSFEDAVPKFLYYKFLMVDWLSHNAASGVPSLTSKTIEEIELLMPSSVNEQRAIAKVLSDMDAEIANLERRQEKLKQVKKGMLQDLLTGKVRLKGQGGAT